MLKYALRPAMMLDLKARLHGELIAPNDQGYDASRQVWNGMIDKGIVQGFVQKWAICSQRFWPVTGDEVRLEF